MPTPGELSTRQLEVLRLLDRGLAAKQIARKLGVAQKTVESHKTLLFAHLQVRTAAQAVHRGHELGLLP